MSLRLDGLEIPEWAGAQPGQPLSLPIAAIDEDPDQPRLEYESEGLQQLAATIAERGVRQAVSVRAHPNVPGRWMLNFGSRRLRASKLAGKSEIPAFVDETINSYDQVIENEQREGLKPLELAMFVQRELSAGRSQAEVAQRLGKSKAYVTYVCALIDAPDCVMQAYREGKCRGISDLYELRKLHERAPDAATRLLAETERLSRRDLIKARVSPPALGALRTLQEKVADTPGPLLGGVPLLSRANASPDERLNGSPSSVPTASTVELTGVLQGTRVRVVLDRVPEHASQVFVLDGEQGICTVSVAKLTELRLGRT